MNLEQAYLAGSIFAPQPIAEVTFDLDELESLGEVLAIPGKNETIEQQEQRESLLNKIGNIASKANRELENKYS